MFWILQVSKSYFKPMGNVDGFVETGKLLCLAGSVGFRLQIWSSSLPMWFKYQYHCQSLCSIIQMCPTCVPPSGHSGSWAVIYLMGQFSKSMTFCLGSDPFMCSSGVSPAVQKQLYKIAFLSASLSMISPIFSGLFSLQTKCGDLFSQSDTHLVQPSPCLGPSNEWRFKKQ